MSDAVRATVPHLRLVFGGKLGTGAEIWACGIKLVGCQTNGQTVVDATTTDTMGNLLPGVLDLAAAQVAAIVDTGGSGGPNLTDALNTNFVPALKTFHATVGRNDSSLTYAKLNAFGATDEQVGGATIEAQFAGVGGGGSTTTPWSTAGVAEFRNTTRTRGRASHGRFSYPAAVTMGSNGQLSAITNAGQGTELATAAQLLLLLSNLNIQGTGGGAVQFLPSIVYTSLPNHVYRSAGSRPATFNPIDRAFWSSIPGEVRRRQSTLKQQSNPAPVIYGSPQT